MRDRSDLRVFISTQDSTCYECGENLARSAWISLVEDKGAFCLSCAGRAHLVFLPYRGCTAYSSGEEALDLVGGGLEVESCEKAL